MGELGAGPASATKYFCGLGQITLRTFGLLLKQEGAGLDDS